MSAPPIFERQFSGRRAICLVDRVLSELGLSVIEQKESLDFLASRITVEDNNGIKVSGSGKGLHHQIGARAESIEHYLTETFLAETVDCQFTCDLVHQDVFRRDGIIQTLATFTNSETPVIPMDLYLDNHSPEVKIPHILLNPADDWAETSDANEYLARYSTNTGTAFGLSESEAVLHALMECIERHTQSELFLNIIGQENNRKFSFLKSHEISDWPLRHKLDIPPFHIFARATNGGAWFFLVAEAFPRMRLCEFGAGCSLSAHHAMERAITEYAQCIGLADGVETDEDRRVHGLFDELPGLKPLETLTVNEKHYDSSLNPGTLTELMENHILSYHAFSPDELLEHCVKNLEGYSIIYKVDSVGKSGYIARVYVPGFDRFHLIRAGLKVVPNQVLL